MGERSYTIELRSAPANTDVTEEVLERFAAALFDDRAIAGPAPSADLRERRLEVRTCVDATDLQAAITAAIGAFFRAAAAAGVSVDLEAIAGCIDDEGHEHDIALITCRGMLG
ncbi:MAG: hypothetical protein M3T56_10340 [Chloroflexota bacterium]|nr:hypothetical protein [Chloroflexota bacterium]